MKKKDRKPNQAKYFPPSHHQMRWWCVPIIKRSTIDIDIDIDIDIFDILNGLPMVDSTIDIFLLLLTK